MAFKLLSCLVFLSLFSIYHGQHHLTHIDTNPYIKPTIIKKEPVNWSFSKEIDNKLEPYGGELTEYPDEIKKLLKNFFEKLDAMLIELKNDIDTFHKTGEFKTSSASSESDQSISDEE